MHFLAWVGLNESCKIEISIFDIFLSQVKIVTSAIDPEINDKFYVIPGIGNFGDRYFGTEPSEYEEEWVVKQHHVEILLYRLPLFLSSIYFKFSFESKKKS